MLTIVKFDYKPRRETHKINNEMIDRHLAPKMKAFRLHKPQL